jgi:indole-3-glycerol phosphate synthase
MISVLTERDHFGGSPEDLGTVRTVVPSPILRKDFILHPAQVWESAAIGADMVLLIVAALEDSQLRELLAEAEAAGLAALVEVHDEEEAERALNNGAAVVGVNNRDLRTFAVDLATAERIAPLLESAVVRIAESGIFSGAEARRMEAAGYDAVLVGESLVRARDPIALLSELRGRR